MSKRKAVSLSSLSDDLISVAELVGQGRVRLPEWVRIKCTSRLGLIERLRQPVLLPPGMATAKRLHALGAELGMTATRTAENSCLLYVTPWTTVDYSAPIFPDASENFSSTDFPDHDIVKPDGGAPIASLSDPGAVVLWGTWTAKLAALTLLLSELSYAGSWQLAPSGQAVVDHGKGRTVPPSLVPYLQIMTGLNAALPLCNHKKPAIGYAPSDFLNLFVPHLLRNQRLASGTDSESIAHLTDQQFHLFVYLSIVHMLECSRSVWYRDENPWTLGFIKLIDEASRSPPDTVSAGLFEPRGMCKGLLWDFARNHETLFAQYRALGTKLEYISRVLRGNFAVVDSAVLVDKLKALLFYCNHVPHQKNRASQSLDQTLHPLRRLERDQALAELLAVGDLVAARDLSEWLKNNPHHSVYIVSYAYANVANTLPLDCFTQDIFVPGGDGSTSVLLACDAAELWEHQLDCALRTKLTAPSALRQLQLDREAEQLKNASLYMQNLSAALSKVSNEKRVLPVVRDRLGPQDVHLGLLLASCCSARANSVFTPLHNFATRYLHAEEPELQQFEAQRSTFAFFVQHHTELLRHCPFRSNAADLKAVALSLAFLFLPVFAIHKDELAKIDAQIGARTILLPAYVGLTQPPPTTQDFVVFGGENHAFCHTHGPRWQTVVNFLAGTSIGGPLTEASAQLWWRLLRAFRPVLSAQISEAYRALLRIVPAPGACVVPLTALCDQFATPARADDALRPVASAGNAALGLASLVLVNAFGSHPVDMSLVNAHQLQLRTFAPQYLCQDERASKHATHLYLPSVPHYGDAVSPLLVSLIGQQPGVKYTPAPGLTELHTAFKSNLVTSGHGVFAPPAVPPSTPQPSPSPLCVGLDLELK